MGEIFKENRGQVDVNISIQECEGIGRNREPVTLGIPFKSGHVWPEDRFVLTRGGERYPVQNITQSLWPDGSVKWTLVDFQADVEKNMTESFSLGIGSDVDTDDSMGKVEVVDLAKTLEVNTGKARFVVDKKKFRPFTDVLIDAKAIINSEECQTVLEDMDGNSYEPEIESMGVEIEGALRTVLKLEGCFGESKDPFARWFARIHFYAGKSNVNIDFTLWNPKPAKHPGGLWDLGDPGAIFFKDLSIQASLMKTESPVCIDWSVNSSQWNEKRTVESVSIYQGSSGGENYKSKNHLNCKGEIPITLKGYQVRCNGDVFDEGLRAEPVIRIASHGNNITMGVRQFWQNFPKALDVDKNNLFLRLFPHQFNELFELQGGEQKTHSFFMNFSESTESSLQCLHPVFAWIDPEHVKNTGAISYLGTNPESENPVFRDLINGIIEGGNSFFERREIIDEYGWRHFGELYADHEAVGYEGGDDFISHYNNQYDFIFCFLRKYLSTGDRRWYVLMDDLARHVRDIDIYRTEKDRIEYNGGLFWHTNHYLDAATCTHRSESVAHIKEDDPQQHGGGPALEHNYTSGLAFHYLLTGEQASKEAALGLADYVVKVIGRPYTLVEFVFNLKHKFPLVKRVFSGEKVRHYRFPFTRGSGNSITALLDAFSLTGERHYIEKAEEVIRGCISPHDEINTRGILNAETGWSYTVCLQAVAKYLDMKVVAGEMDDMFHYSLETFLKYIEWMYENEYPYLDKTEELEYPNETWPAQDMRKSSLFYHAARYSAGKKRDAYLEKGRYYYEYSVNAVASFETKSLTRPLVLLMQNSVHHHCFVECPEKFDPIKGEKIKTKTVPDNVLSRWGLVKSIGSEFITCLSHFSPKKEIHWIRSRMYWHA